mmetsp:Transcript_34690/g.82626  ORF Transcript_34690/g.82626 Transcript_34690/m.82626 type:complete len:101 (-) Transcript_34690:104-406(-)
MEHDLECLKALLQDAFRVDASLLDDLARNIKKPAGDTFWSSLSTSIGATEMTVLKQNAAAVAVFDHPWELRGLPGKSSARTSKYPVPLSDSDRKRPRISS